jgi:hypothetical protein
MNLSTAAIRLDYVHAEDREIAQVRKGLAAGRAELLATIARVDQLHVELPVAQEPGDAADQAALALYEITDGLAELDATLRRLARRI